MSKRVLVVGINYAPEHTGIAPYTSQACAYLQGQGHQIQVLTGVPHYPHWSVPEAYRRALRTDESHADVAVRRLRHVVPSKQSAASRGLYELSFAANVAAQRLPWQPDVVVAVVPSLLSALVARRIARRDGARLVLWVQDLMGAAAAQSGISGGDRVAKLTGSLERRALRSGDQVVVINEAFRAAVEVQGVEPQRISVVRNWSHVAAPTADRTVTRARLGWGDDEVIALHSGNMGLKQGLENVVEAARLSATSHPHVRFVLMGDGSQRRELEDLGTGIPTLSFLPPADDADFSDVLAAADVLLVNERGSAVEMSLPSKLTSYFKAGQAVLAAVPETGGTAAEVRRSGAGRVVPCDDPEALLEGTLALTSQRSQHEAFQRAALAYVEAHLTPQAALTQLETVLLGDYSVVPAQRLPQGVADDITA